MNDTNHDGLSEAGIRGRASQIADGTASLEDATELIAEAARQCASGRVTSEMCQYLADSFQCWISRKRLLNPTLDGNGRSFGHVRVATLDKAFGLQRATSGQPPIDNDTLCEVAAEVWKCVLTGKSPTDAIAIVASQRRRRRQRVTSKRDVAGAWSSHRVDGLRELRLLRSFAGQGWSQAEVAKLKHAVRRDERFSNAFPFNIPARGRD